mmetsp:Transcript_85105/g.239591  ORF Transcript_85105/g.239591 Transcript_85105/m.239591 type:complete len:96 (+) Transcript_85105:112-399(+)
MEGRCLQLLAVTWNPADWSLIDSTSTHFAANASAPASTSASTSSHALAAGACASSAQAADDDALQGAGCNQVPTEGSNTHFGGGPAASCGLSQTL